MALAGVAACGSGDAADDPDASDAAPIMSGRATPPDGSGNLNPNVTGHRVPTVKDFTLEVKTTQKQCFGSAGCTVVYHVVLDVAPGVDTEHEYTATYEVSGVEGGPQINSFTVRDGRYVADVEESASISSPDTKLEAKVTDVEPTG